MFLLPDTTEERAKANLKKQIERERKRKRGLEGCKEAEKEEWRLVLKYRLGVKDIISRRRSQKPPNTTVTVFWKCLFIG